VWSRRLGRSLGVDTVPFKTCNQSCVYCQLGRTADYTLRRRSFYSTTAIFSEIAAALDRDHANGIDWITFVGSGETTLLAGLGPLIRFVKSLTDIPVAVITNGSLLGHADVRRELRIADAVLPSVDAGSSELYRRINRPHPDLSFDRHVDGLVAFRRMFAGRLWVEVMLVAGVNDNPAALADLAATLRTIEPDEIHLGTPTRPPAEPWVVPPAAKVVELAAELLGSVAEVVLPGGPNGSFELEGDLDQALIDIVTRHPLREEEVRRIVSQQVLIRTDEIVARLVDSGRVRVVERLGERYWCAADSVFPEPRREAEQESGTLISA
jgi:wyosine [tRNA(Phe)-imidazoG37] synthetase (radical SAM superfamily)